jgi:hypothetical protein
MLGQRVVGCKGCGSRNPDQCLKDQRFVPLYTKEELYKQFRERIRNQEILLREYRDIAALLWAMGGFDEEIDETLIAGVEQHEKPTIVSLSSADPGPSGNGGAVRSDNPKSKTNNPRPTKRQLRSSAVQGGGNK